MGIPDFALSTDEPQPSVFPHEWSVGPFWKDVVAIKPRGLISNNLLYDALRVPPAFHTGVPSAQILQREGRQGPAVRAGPRLMRRNLASLTLQTLGHGPDVPLFPLRQRLRSLHVPSSR